MFVSSLTFITSDTFSSHSVLLGVGSDGGEKHILVETQWDDHTDLC